MTERKKARAREREEEWGIDRKGRGRVERWRSGEEKKKRERRNI